MKYKNQIFIILKKLKDAFTDLIPIIVVVVFFQSVVIKQPFPEIGEIILGVLLVIVGLMLFIEGLEISLFPIGEAMAHALAKKGSMLWLVIFSFALGFSTTIAEPALIAVAKEASVIASEANLIPNNIESMSNYAMGLRLSVAFSVWCFKNTKRMANILFNYWRVYCSYVNDDNCATRNNWASF